MVLGTGKRVNMTLQGVVLLSHMVLFIYAWDVDYYAYINTTVDALYVIMKYKAHAWIFLYTKILHFIWLILFCILAIFLGFLWQFIMQGQSNNKIM